VISVILPTVDGRKVHLSRCHAAYEATMRNLDGAEILVIRNQPACGVAWQIGASRSDRPYLHFTADDLVPHEGWWEAAVEAVDRGVIPAPLILGPTGAVEEVGPETTGCTRIPFCTRDQWTRIGPMIPLHYYTDNWFSFKARQAGYSIAEVPDYAFTHNWAQPGRQSGRMAQDKAAFESYTMTDYETGA
jgi:hypothetical protein